MTETSSIEIETSSPKRNSRRPPMFQWVVFFVILLFTVAIVFLAIRDQHVVEQEIEQTQVYLQELQTEADRFSKYERLEADVKRLATGIMKLDVDISDLPTLSSDRVIATMKDMDTIFVNVPPGKHTLHVTCQWSPNDSNGTANSQPTDRDPEESDQQPETYDGTKTWEIMLTEAGCYRIAMLQAHSKPAPFGWKIESAVSGFEPQTNFLDLPDYVGGGASSSSSTENFFYLPNQSDRTADPNQRSQSPDLVPLFSVTFHGTIAGVAHSVELSVHLRSFQSQVIR